MAKSIIKWVFVTVTFQEIVQWNILNNNLNYYYVQLATKAPYWVSTTGIPNKPVRILTS